MRAQRAIFCFMTTQSTYFQCILTAKATYNAAHKCPTIMCSWSCPATLHTHSESQTNMRTPKRGKRPLLFFRIFGRVPPAQHVSAKPCGTQSRTGTVPMRQPGCTCSGGPDRHSDSHTRTREFNHMPSVLLTIPVRVSIGTPARIANKT